MLTSIHWNFGPEYMINGESTANSLIKTILACHTSDPNNFWNISVLLGNFVSNNDGKDILESSLGINDHLSDGFVNWLTFVPSSNLHCLFFKDEI